jgi:catalase
MSLCGGKSHSYDLVGNNWKNIDAGVGGRIEEKARAGSAPQPAEGMGQR